MEGRFVECNPAACRRLGYTRVELLNLNTAAIDGQELTGFAERCADGGWWIRL